MKSGEVVLVVDDVDEDDAERVRDDDDVDEAERVTVRDNVFVSEYVPDVVDVAVQVSVKMSR